MNVKKITVEANQINDKTNLNANFEAALMAKSANFVAPPLKSIKVAANNIVLSEKERTLLDVPSSEIENLTSVIDEVMADGPTEKIVLADATEAVEKAVETAAEAGNAGTASTAAAAGSTAGASWAGLGLGLLGVGGIAAAAGGGGGGGGGDDPPPPPPFVFSSDYTISDDTPEEEPKDFCDDVNLNVVTNHAAIAGLFQIDDAGNISDTPVQHYGDNKDDPDYLLEVNLTADVPGQILLDSEHPNWVVGEDSDEIVRAVLVAVEGTFTDDDLDPNTPDVFTPTDPLNAEVSPTVITLGTHKDDFLVGYNGVARNVEGLNDNDIMLGFDGKDTLLGDAYYIGGADRSQITAITFAGSYDAGDVIKVTFNDVEYSYTVPDSPSHTDISVILNDLALFISGDSNLDTDLGVAGVAYSVSDAVLSLESTAPDSFTLSAAVDNVVADPTTVYVSTFDNTVDPDDNDLVSVIVGGKLYTSTSGKDADASLTDIADQLNVDGISSAYDADTDTLTTDVAVDFAIRTDNDAYRKVEINKGGDTAVFKDVKSATTGDLLIVTVNGVTFTQEVTVVGEATDANQLLAVQAALTLMEADIDAHFEGDVASLSTNNKDSVSIVFADTETYNIDIALDYRFSRIDDQPVFSTEVDSPSDQSNPTVNTTQEALFAIGEEGVIYADGDLASDTLIGGCDADTYVILTNPDVYDDSEVPVLLTDGQNMLTEEVYDTIVGLDLSESGDYIALNSSVDTVLDGSLETFDEGATLEEAVNSLFGVDNLFATDTDDVNVATIITFEGEDYLIALGADRGEVPGFGQDDVIVKVTGYVDTLNTDDFLLATDSINGFIA
ncbi:MAG: hypothetical protein RL563_319 [Pseudomonadota bacterium]|jgi:hypothetical protein